MILKPVDDVAMIRPHLEVALKRVKSKTGERWTLPFVFERIESGHAGLFRFVDRGEHIAYLVCERLNGYETVLNIWILEGAPTGRNMGEKVRLIDGLAKSVGASYWKWESPRKGWARAMREYITSTRTVYERKVP